MAQRSAPPSMPGATAACTQATVFGLDVCASQPMGCLAGSRAPLTGRRLDVEILDAQEGMQAVPAPGTGTIVCDQRHQDGSVSFQIERHAEGYLLWGPGHGAHLLSHDGRRLACAQHGPGWERLVIAQALPFAALLQGVEVFHASAVTIAGAAIGLLGPSGSGKTSVALALCQSGAEFLADDVLAVEGTPMGLAAHPGTSFAGVEESGGERLVQMPSADGPVPLAALFFLDRLAQGPSAPLARDAANPQLLLAATFNSVLLAPGRLAALLDVCALATRGQVERVVFAEDAHAFAVAATIEQRVRARS